jgi:hypothetical protein
MFEMRKMNHAPPGAFAMTVAQASTAVAVANAMKDHRPSTGHILLC